jgi:hypothetical protein
VNSKNSQGLYREEFEKDSCGVGFIANIKGRKSHQVITDALTMLERAFLFRYLTNFLLVNVANSVSNYQPMEAMALAWCSFHAMLRSGRNVEPY